MPPASGRSRSSAVAVGRAWPRSARGTARRGRSATRGRRRPASSVAAGLGPCGRGGGASPAARRARRPRTGWALPVPRPGRPRVPIGMISASATAHPALGDRRRGGQAVERPARAARRPRGRREAAKSANASAVVYSGSKPSIVAHPRGVDAAAVGQEAELLGREVGHPGRAAGREPRPPTAKRGQRRPWACRSRRTAWESIRTPSPATLKVPGDVAGHRVARARRSRSSSWRNCRRGSKPSTVGITGSRKYDVIGLVDVGAEDVGRRAAWSRGRRGGGGRSRGRSPRPRRRPWRSPTAAPGAAPCPR